MSASLPPRYPSSYVLVFACLSILTTLSSLHAQQNPQPYFLNYSTEQGMPSPEVYCIMQDSRGQMWFGTDNGAATFDGYRFQTYGAKEGLASNVVFDIHEDAKGRIWFGAMTGEAFILEGDTIVPYRFNHVLQKYRKQFKDSGLGYLQPREETAYFELVNLGILKIDSTGREELITTEKPVSKLILEVEGYDQGLCVTIVKRDKTEQIPFWQNYQREKQITLLTSVSPEGRFQKEIPIRNDPSFNYLFDAQKLSNGNWLLLNCNHLAYLQEQKIQWVMPFPFKANLIVEGNDHEIWFCGKEGRGLRKYADLNALKKGQYSTYLEDLSISNVYQDTKGGLWVSTIEQGVFYCSDVDLLIYGTQFGFSSELVTAIAIKNESELFVGCKNGDIFEVDLEENQVTNTLVNYYGHFNHELFYHPQNLLLWSGGGYWKNGRWNYPFARHHVTQEQYVLPISQLNNLHLNHKGDLVGCNYAGVYSIDLENDTIIVDPTHFINIWERAYSVHTDQQQRLWLGNARGIFEFQDSLLVSPNIDHPAFHSRVEDIHEFSDGSLVFGTKGWGIIRWQGEDILQISTDDGLTSNMIEDVHVNENGILWVATLSGLNKITFDASAQPTVRAFSMMNSLPTNEITKIRSYDGQIWLCSPKGLIKFHEPAEETVAPTPILQSLIVNGATTSLDPNQSFPSDQNNLSFHFLAINYQQNGQIPYRYRLSETDLWQSTQNRTVNYPKLSPGTYRFEVQSQNQDGYWSKSATYAFEILPPWWQTWWARMLLLIVILTGLILYQRELRKRLQKEASIQQQITDLERSALQAQMNPHFIFNCLNSIQNFILQNDRKQAVEYLSRFARLVRHNLDASVRGKISLEEELSLLDNYLALERERFEHRFDYRLVVEPTLNQSFIRFPPLLIQPYVENAIIHGLAKKGNQGLIEVHFSKENEYLLVKIQDNGPGYHPDLHQEKDSRHHSVGMSITEKRLKLLSQNSEEKVKILTSVGKNQGSGTEVDIYIGLS